MGFRLKTSTKTKDIFDEIGSSTNLKPFAQCKIAVALSLKSEQPINEYVSNDVNGLELQRSTVTGEYDGVFKALLELNLQQSLSEDDYYPRYMKLHIDRGAELLYNKFRYNGRSLEKFLKSTLPKGDD